MSVLFERIAFIGLGHIGSSLCHAIKRGKIANHIAGYARSAKTRETALRIGLVDSIHDTAAGAVANADLVFLCVPVGVCGEVVAEMASALKPGALLTDVGSVKAAIVRDVLVHLPKGVDFVPGHPVAGTEQSGPESGFAELFHNRWCILTPLPDSNPDAVSRLEKFWQACGANVELMTPEHHDLVLAITSHLPHLIAYNTVATAADLEEVTNSEVIKYSAGGFRDLPASLHLTLQCGAMYFSTTAKRFWKCSEDSRKICRRCSGLSVGAMVKRSSICSHGRGKFGAASSAPDRKRLHPILAVTRRPANRSVRYRSA